MALDWFGVTEMRRLVQCAAVLTAITIASIASAQVRQSPDSLVSVSGVVHAADNGPALPFSVVTIPSRAIQVFSNDSGRFRLAGLAPGAFVVQVRHLGFAPRDIRLTLRPGQDTILAVSLAPVAVNLAAMRIRASRGCDEPGAPRAADDTAFAAVFDQLRQNAVQYQALATTYPFAALFSRTIDTEEHNGLLDRKLSDTTVFRSDHRWVYHPGEIIGRDHDARSPTDFVLHIPTLDVIADSAFLATHCFANGGLESLNGTALLRVDFRVATSVSVPDVDGSMYLDTATYQIRRTVVRLSRRPREAPYIDSAVVITTFAELYPSLPIITSILARNRLYYPNRPTAPRASIETQQLVSFAWAHGKPGDVPALAVTDSVRSRSSVERTLVAVDSATKQPLAGVELVGLAIDSTVMTGVDGRASLAFLPDGDVQVMARKIGYGAQMIRIPAASADASVVRVALAKLVTLAPMLVKDQNRPYISPALQRFEERRRLGMGGYFIGDSILRREENRSLGNVLRSHAPGAMIAEGSHAANYLLKSPRCANGGPPQVYLDGVPLAAPPPADPKPDRDRPPTSARAQAAAVPAFDLSQFNVSDLAGVEYYPDGTTLPEEFDQTSLRCGALLLWTREK